MLTSVVPMQRRDGLDGSEDLQGLPGFGQAQICHICTEAPDVLKTKRTLAPVPSMHPTSSAGHPSESAQHGSLAVPSTAQEMMGVEAVGLQHYFQSNTVAEAGPLRIQASPSRLVCSANLR